MSVPRLAVEQTALIVAATSIALLLAVVASATVWLLNDPGGGLNEKLARNNATTALLGVSAAVVVSGVAIAAPLYIALWGQAGRDLFQIHMELEHIIRNHEQNLSASSRHLLREEKRRIGAEFRELERKIAPTRFLLRLTLGAASGELVLLGFIAAIPGTNLGYGAAHLAMIVALGLAFLFFYLIISIHRTGPVKRQIEVQQRVVDLLNSEK